MTSVYHRSSSLHLLFVETKAFRKRSANHLIETSIFAWLLNSCYPPLGGNPMNSEQLNDTLSLFSLLILADGKIFAEETEVMGRQLFKIQQSLETEILFTPDMGVEWFKDNLFSLRTVMQGTERDVYLRSAIVKLSGLEKPAKMKIYNALIRIAHADADYHDKERSIVKLAEEVWDLNTL